MREPTETECILALEALGQDPKADFEPTPKNAVLASLVAAWASVEANIGGRAAAIVKTKIEEAGLWLERCVER